MTQLVSTGLRLSVGAFLLEPLSSRCHFSNGTEWSIMVLGFAKYWKMKTQVQKDLQLRVQGLCFSNLLLFRQVAC